MSRVASVVFALWYAPATLAQSLCASEGLCPSEADLLAKEDDDTISLLSTVYRPRDGYGGQTGEEVDAIAHFVEIEQHKRSVEMPSTPQGRNEELSLQRLSKLAVDSEGWFDDLKQRFFPSATEEEEATVAPALQEAATTEEEKATATPTLEEAAAVVETTTGQVRSGHPAGRQGETEEAAVVKTLAGQQDSLDVAAAEVTPGQQVGEETEAKTVTTLIATKAKTTTKAEEADEADEATAALALALKNAQESPSGKTRKALKEAMERAQEAEERVQEAEA